MTFIGGNWTSKDLNPRYLPFVRLLPCSQRQKWTVLLDEGEWIGLIFSF